MQQRMEIKPEENLENSSEEKIEPTVEQNSEEAKVTLSQSTESTEPVSSVSEQSEQEKNAKAKNPNSFFAKRVFIPCPDGEVDHLHMLKVKKDGSLMQGIATASTDELFKLLQAQGDAKALFMFSILMMLNSSPAQQAANQSEEESDNEEEINPCLTM